jgi:hypothetical protein
VDPDRLLDIYLDDHHAAAGAFLQVARRARLANPEGELAAFLDRLVGELTEERRELERMMRELGLRPSRAKDVVAGAPAQLGRLKLNGRVRGYSPLSRVLELEGLEAGVTGKLALWRTLETTGRLGEEWPPVLARLREQAEAQREELERHRLEALRLAFG